MSCSVFGQDCRQIHAVQQKAFMSDFAALNGIHRHHGIFDFVKRQEYDFLLQGFMENLDVHDVDNTKGTLTAGQQSPPVNAGATASAQIGMRLIGHILRSHAVN